MKTKFAALVNCGNEVYDFNNKITEAAALIVADVNSQSNLMTESIAKSEIELILTGEKNIRGVSRKFITENIGFIRDAIGSINTASVGRRGDKFQFSASNMEPEIFDDPRDAKLSLLKHISHKSNLTPESKIVVIIDGEVMDTGDAINVIRGEYYGDGKPTISSKEMFGDDEDEVEKIPTDRTGPDSKDPLSFIPIKDRAAAYTGKQLLNDKMITEGEETEGTEETEDGSDEPKKKKTDEPEKTAVERLNFLTTLTENDISELERAARDLVQSSKVSYADAYSVVSKNFQELTGSIDSAFDKLVDANIDSLLGEHAGSIDKNDPQTKVLILIAMVMTAKEISAHADKFQTGEGKELVAAAIKAKDHFNDTGLEGVIGEVDGEDLNMDDPIEDASQVAELPTDGTQPTDTVDLGIPGGTATPGATDLPDADDIMSGSFGVEPEGEGEVEEDGDDDQNAGQPKDKKD